MLFGCSSEGEPASKEQVQVRLSGAVQASGLSKGLGEGMIDPQLPLVDDKGLPPRQLPIGIMTVELPQASMPTVLQWDNETAYLDRGFFGGSVPLPPGTSVFDGNIEYTNRQGTALQQVFYDEMGTYYYLVCVYPYESIVDPEDIEAMRDPLTGVTVYFEIDGSHDVMASTAGMGNIDYPFNSALVFSHKLTSLRCKFVAESSVAKGLYGDIVSVELLGQPDVVALNVGANALDPTTAVSDARTATVDYEAVRVSTGDMSLPDTYLTADAVEFGYMLAMPARKYTFRIFTQKRGPLYVTYDFDADNVGTRPLAGWIYNLTFTMMESAEIKLEAAPATPWWLDQTYD